jgi:ATP-binding protein involved in chromosome partitioning
MSDSTSSSDTLTANDVLNCLKVVIDPSTGIDVVRANLISGVTIKNNKVGFLITIDPAQKETHATLRGACEQAVLRLPKVTSVTAVLTAHNAEPIAPTAGGAYTKPRERAVWNLTPLEHVKHVVAVASGKGGVGKSTVAAHLAMALVQNGKRVGLLDADIYGPSIPTMFGLSGQPKIIDGKMQPMLVHGVKCMSMELITGEEAAILRGPMISKSLQQMLRMTHWATADAPLDFLLVDMPPGTGDVHLSLVQQVPLTGAILVTTPQLIALKDARKCAQMFAKVEVQILGVVENMSYLEDTKTGEKNRIFGEGGGALLAQEFNTRLIAELPIAPELGSACDKGNSLFSASENTNIAKQFLELATSISSRQIG